MVRLELFSNKEELFLSFSLSLLLSFISFLTSLINCLVFSIAIVRSTINPIFHPATENHWGILFRTIFLEDCEGWSRKPYRRKLCAFLDAMDDFTEDFFLKNLKVRFFQLQILPRAIPSKDSWKYRNHYMEKSF